jgi:NADH:ubiquinone oxidoreductase subunit 3 (subunit A)
MSHLADWGPIAAFTFVAITFPWVTYLATRILRQDRPNPIKVTTYECGEVPEGEAQIQFHFQYYMFAIMFVVFDVAAIFLILWALYARPSLEAFPEVNWLPHIALAIFVLVMTAATLYSLKKEEAIYI